MTATGRGRSARHRRARRSSPADAGYSLLEMLLVTSIVGMIVLATAPLVTFLNRSIGAVEAAEPASLRLALELAPRFRADVRRTVRVLDSHLGYRRGISTLVLATGSDGRRRIVVYHHGSSGLERLVYRGAILVRRERYPEVVRARLEVTEADPRGAPLARLRADDSGERRVLTVVARVAP